MNVSSITSFLRVLFISGHRVVKYLQPSTSKLLKSMHNTRKLRYLQTEKYVIMQEWYWGGGIMSTLCAIKQSWKLYYHSSCMMTIIIEHNVYTYNGNIFFPCRQATPSQSSNWGQRLAQSASRRPRLLAIPVFDRIAGLCNRHRNSNRGICLC